MIERLSTPAERQRAGQIAVAVQRGDAVAIWSHGPPQLKQNLPLETIAKMKSVAPTEPPRLIDVRSQWQRVDGVTTEWKLFTYETGSANRWAVIQVGLVSQGEKTALDSVFIQPLDRAPTSVNALTLQGLDNRHYAWLIAMTLAVVTSLAALVLVIRTRGLRLKWLWAVGVLFSFVTFSLDWATGAWAIQPISFLLLGAAGMQAGPLAPWIMSFALPLPAIAFLILKAIGGLPIRNP